MKSKPIQLTMTRKLVGAILIVLVGTVFLAWWQFNTIAAETPTLDDETLRAKAIILARSFGLKGEPTAEKTERMTLAEAAKLLDEDLGKDAGQFGLTPEMPVFVYALRGEIEPTGPRQIDPDNPNPKYDRMLIILNAQNGDTLIQGDYYVNAPMPIELP